MTSKDFMNDMNKFLKSTNEELVHGTPGEDTSKNKGDQPSNGMFQINEDSVCSVKAQEKLQESFNMMMEEMKALHADDSEYTAEDYVLECEGLISNCLDTMKANGGELINEGIADEENKVLWDLQQEYARMPLISDVTKVAFQKIDKVWYFDFIKAGENHRIYIDKSGNIQDFNMDTNKAKQLN